MLQELTKELMQSINSISLTPGLTTVAIPYPWNRPHHVAIMWHDYYIVCRCLRKDQYGTAIFKVLTSSLPFTLKGIIELPVDGVSCFIPEFAAVVVDVDGHRIDGNLALIRTPMDCLINLMGERAAIAAKGVNSVATPPTRIERNTPKVGFPVGRRWIYAALRNIVQVKDYLFFATTRAPLDRIGILVMQDGLREVSGAQISRNFIKLRPAVSVDVPAVAVAAAGFREEMMDDLLYSLES